MAGYHEKALIEISEIIESFEAHYQNLHTETDDMTDNSEQIILRVLIPDLE